MTELISRPEIIREFNLTESIIAYIRKKPSFPKPVSKRENVLLYDYMQIKSWLATNKVKRHGIKEADKIWQQNKFDNKLACEFARILPPTSQLLGG